MAMFCFRCVCLASALIVAAGSGLMDQTDSKSLPDFNYSNRYRGSKSKLWPWFKDPKCCVTTSHPCEPPSDDTFCFGAQVHYSHTTLSPLGAANLTRGFSTLEALSADFAGLPECWPLFKELVCSIQFAPCQNLKAKLVPRELCLRAVDKCRFLAAPGLWPTELTSCGDQALFSDDCFAATSKQGHLQWQPVADKCQAPLVRSDFQRGWHAIAKCAANCTSHWLTPSEHDSLNSFTHFIVVAAGMLTALTLASLLINIRQKANHCEVDITAELNTPLAWYLFCHMLVIGCWALTLFPNVKKLLTCRQDGSLRMHEIAQEQNYACVIQFFVMYCGIIGCGIWLAIFACYFFMFNTQSTPRLQVLLDKNKTSWLQLTWAVPILLVLYPLCAGRVEADGISGFCFIGYTEPIMSLLFVYVPVSVLYLIAVIMCLLGVACRKLNNQNCVNTDVYISKMQLLVFFLFHTVALCSAWAIQLMHYHWPLVTREQSFVHYLHCQLKKSVTKVTVASLGLLSDACELKHRPDIRLIHMHVLCFFLCSFTADICLLTNKNNYNIWLGMVRKLYKYVHLNISGKNDLLTKPAVMSEHPDEPRTTTDEEIPLNPMGGEAKPDTDASNDEPARKNESQRTFRKRLANRTKEYRKRSNSRCATNNTCTTNRTPSSLRSTSLSSALNCSSVELPFPPDDIAENKTPNVTNSMGFPFFAMPWLQPNLVAPQMFYPPPFPTPLANVNNSATASVNMPMPYPAIPNMYCMPPHIMMQMYANPSLWQQPSCLTPQTKVEQQNTANVVVEQETSNKPDDPEHADVKNNAQLGNSTMNSDSDESFSSESTCDSDEAELIAMQFKDSETSLNN